MADEEDVVITRTYTVTRKVREAGRKNITDWNKKIASDEEHRAKLRAGQKARRERERAEKGAQGQKEGGSNGE